MLYPDAILTADTNSLEKVVHFHFTQLFKRSVVLQDNTLIDPIYLTTQGESMKAYIVLVKKNANDSVMPKDLAHTLLDKCIKELFQEDKVNIGYSVSIEGDTVLAMHIDILNN
ncbi:hypothetical protein BGX26_003570 [Mortierella sp. AD094]|nr:hypothetical protein BGX26_003570 [Mortierella sp. AD094]